ELLNRLRQRVDMRLMMALELDRQIEHGLLQQSAVGAELIGGHGLLLRAQRGVEDGDVVVRRRRMSLATQCEAFLAGEQCDRCRRQGDPAEAGEEAAPMGNEQAGLVVCHLVWSPYAGAVNATPTIG